MRKRGRPALWPLSEESHSSRFCLSSDQPRPCPGASPRPGLRLLRSLLRWRAASGLWLLRNLSCLRAFFLRPRLLCFSPCFCAGLRRLVAVRRVLPATAGG